MAKGISLHLGLNQIDPKHYDGWNGALNGCVNDANAMYALAKDQGFFAQQLLNEEATRNHVIQQLEHAAATLLAGDIFFISYSGHGGQVPDTNDDEGDHLDETWCLFDAQLLDDELYLLWSRFKEGVRILVISDSCHSGTITKAVRQDMAIHYSKQTPRHLPYEQAIKVWQGNKRFYQAIKVSKNSSELKATVRLLSGCQDNQYSYDGVNNGAFTAQLLRVWDDGRFKGNYQQFHQRIMMNMPAYQSPNHWVIGINNRRFAEEKPFQC